MLNDVDLEIVLFDQETSATYSFLEDNWPRF